MFVLDEEQQKKLGKWLADKPTRAVGAIGGRYTYCFTPTSLGVVTKVLDTISGDEIDLTDYASW